MQAQWMTLLHCLEKHQAKGRVNSSIKLQFSTVCSTSSFCLAKITKYLAVGGRATQFNGNYPLNPNRKGNMYVYV